MDKVFPPHEIALLLREKGFNEECQFHYTKDSKILTRNGFFVNVHSLKLKAPSYKQVIDWLHNNFELKVYHVINGNDLLDVILYDFKKLNQTQVVDLEPENLQIGYDMILKKALEIIPEKCEYCNSLTEKCDKIEAGNCKNYVKPKFTVKYRNIKLTKNKKLEIAAEELFRKPFINNIPLADIQTDGKDVVACMVSFALSDTVKEYYLNNK